MCGVLLHPPHVNLQATSPATRMYMFGFLHELFMFLCLTKKRRWLSRCKPGNMLAPGPDILNIPFSIESDYTMQPPDPGA